MLRALIAAAILAGSMAHALTIADGSQARMCIVLPADASAAEQTAAAELTTYLEKITGAELATMREDVPQPMGRILVGPSQAAKALLPERLIEGLGSDEFIIRTVGEDLLLVGGRPRGTLYAVYSFLEDDLGCRWLTWYGEESVPTRETLQVEDLDRRGTPALRVRDMTCHTNTTSDRELMKRFLVRNRMQGPDLRFTGDLTAYGGTSHAFAYPKDGWLVHTLFHWVPPDQHFEAHPDWFSLSGEQRVKTRQLCFTNPGLRQFLTEAILARIGEADPAGTYSVSAMDWEGAFCQCPQCRALAEKEGTPGAPLFDYLAELGPAVKERYPQAHISTLAYRKGQSEAPPKTIKLPDNVIIIFAPIDDNFAAPIEHPSNASTLENLTNWRRATDHLWVWYYPNTYGPALPCGNLGRAASDFRLFKRIGVEGCYLEHDAPGVYDSRRLSDIQTWLLTKLAWDPDRDLEALVKDFTDHYYGPAGVWVGVYVQHLERATTMMRSTMGWNAGTGQHRFLSGLLLETEQEVLAWAERLVADDPELLARVRRARMSLDYACILLWDRLGSTGAIRFTKDEVVARYRQTYTDTVSVRNLPERREALVKAMEDGIHWQAVKTELKPLPAPLDAIPPERIRQLTPETATLHGGGARLVEDPDAAAGFAATMEVSLTKPSYAPATLSPNAFNFGYYDSLTRRQQHAYAGAQEPLKAEPYTLYAIGRTALGPQCLVWFDWSWQVQFPDVSGLYDPDDPRREWDVYASLRFEGPAYGDAGQEDKNRFYVDRVVLVVPEGRQVPQMPAGIQ